MQECVVKGQNIKNKTGTQPSNVPPSRGQGAHSVLKCNKSIKSSSLNYFGRWVGWSGAEGWEGAEALAASDSVPGHLYVTGGWRTVIANTCVFMGPLGTPVMREKRLKWRESNVQRCKREKRHK